MSDFDELLDPGVKNSDSTIVGERIPNANAVLTLGILSIVGCVFYILPGLICGIIALSLYPKVKRCYLTDPARFEASYKNAKGGFVCAIIGTSLAALYLILFLVALGIGATLFGRF